ncbi:MAG: threonine ammonia-lyase [Alphaproteobacteria bacterium]|nr:threonine ammonia-lyase [Alphaproteobacteria bacterium]
MSIEIADIEAAADAIAGTAFHTPIVVAAALGAAIGADIRLKLECLQPTASFKVRGAANKLAALLRAGSRYGVVACSAGNHAQGVAYYAGLHGLAATIVMPRGTPFTKVERTAAFGARVVLEGDTLVEAEAHAHQFAAREGLTFVHPYDDAAVIAGQGTVALEMLADAPDLDCLVVPIGGGGLIAGMAVAARARNPGVTIIGVEAENYPSMKMALRGEEPLVGGDTLAEGIAVKTPGVLTLPIVRRLVDDIVLVGETAIEEAVDRMADAACIVAEGAGAAGLAAVLDQPGRFAGRKVGLVVSGGNIDHRVLASVLLRGLVRGGRMVRLRVQISDAPGNLARVTRVIGNAGGNIVEIVHQRLFHNVPVKQADVDAVVETRNRAHGEDIRARLEAAGFATWIIAASG